MVSLRAVRTDDGQHRQRGRARRAPPPRPTARRTRPNSSATAAQPPSASGSSSAGVVNPSSFVLATCGHSPSGGLSIATVPPGSSAPNRNACQDWPMLRTAAS